MNKLRLFMATLAATCIALIPAISSANDDLDDMTMEVFDDISDIDGAVTEMRGPDGDESGSTDFDGDHDGV